MPGAVTRPNSVAAGELVGSGRVCGGCGYALKGLRVGATCPECGRRIARNAVVAPVEAYRAEWYLRQLRVGATVLFGGCVLTPLAGAVILLAWVLGFRAYKPDGVVLLLAVMAMFMSALLPVLPLFVVSVIGGLVITPPAPGWALVGASGKTEVGEPDASVETVRFATRMVLLGCAAMMPLALWALSGESPGREFDVFVFCAMVLGGLAALFCGCEYLRRLSDRADFVGVGNMAESTMLGAGVLVVLLPLTVFAFTWLWLVTGPVLVWAFVSYARMVRMLGLNCRDLMYDQAEIQRRAESEE